MSMTALVEREHSPLMRDRADALLRVEDLVVTYPARQGRALTAVSGVSFEVARGETLGLVGESGCGKSSTGRAIMQLPPPASGRVILDGCDLTGLNAEALRQTRSRMQMIFQDPISSLNPRRNVRDIIGEGLDIWGRHDDRDEHIDAVLEAVGLDPAAVGKRRPHEFSGGQCQRVCIARSLVLTPEILICDEPVSALDVSVQAQILNLLEDMKARYRLTLLFIAHDLAVVKNISDRVAVMYLGKLCEIGPSDALYRGPAHPYTRALLASIPVPDPQAPQQAFALSGDLPSPMQPPSGCRFRTRCPQAKAVCAEREPEMRPLGFDHAVACHFPLAASSMPADSTGGI